MKAEAYIVKFDEKNLNERTYPIALKDSILKNANDGQMPYGQFQEDDSTNLLIPLTNISHTIDSIEYDEKENALLCKFEILNTPKGKLAKYCLENGAKLYASIVGICSDMSGDGVIREYKYCRVDLVKNSGFANDFCQVKIINE